MMTDLLGISRSLQQWYAVHKREMPWRSEVTPYRVWVSEVILQQTRVNQGMDYFLRFMERFPDVQALADADEEEVLKYWQGLGYYSRARNLHKAARQVVDDFGGVVPDNYRDLLKLSGVGPYTAAAVASIAYGLPHAVVDGNVYRVLSRLFGIATPIDSTAGKKEFAELADLLLDAEHPSDHNQAVMELGALVCLPRGALCEECPLMERCYAYEQQRVYDFPVKEKRVKVRNRYLNYFHIMDGDFTYIVKREQDDIWRNLYEFPLIEYDALVKAERMIEDQRFQELFSCGAFLEMEHVSFVKHVLTHQVLHVNFYRVRLSKSLEPNDPNWVRINVSELDNYPVSALIEKYLENIG